MTNVSGSQTPVWCRMEVNPTSGDSITIKAPFDHLHVYKGTTTAALTVVLPASPVDGDHVHLSTVAAISTLTLSPAVTGMASGMAAGTGAQFFYSAPQGVWYVWHLA